MIFPQELLFLLDTPSLKWSSDCFEECIWMPHVCWMSSSLLV